MRGVVHHIGSTAFSGHYTTCAKKKVPPNDEQEATKGATTESNAATDNNSPQDNEEQWVFFDDRVGVKKDMDYVTGVEKNQRNCYMALYELK